MTRTLRILACAMLLASSYVLSGCCATLDACANCASCALSGPLFWLANDDDAPGQSVEIGVSLDVGMSTASTVSY